MRYAQVKADDCYRKIEGMMTDEIARAVKLPYLDTIDVIQKIFAMDMKKKDREL